MREATWLRGLATLVTGYLQRIARTVRVQLLAFDSNGALTEASFGDVLVPSMARGEILLPFWNAHSLLLMSGFISSDELRIFAQDFQAVADDSRGGQITQQIFTRLGISGRKLSVLSPESRLEDVRTILEVKPNLVIAADSHGPYRDVGTGTARLVRSYRGGAILLSARSRSLVTIFPKIRMVVPLPRSTIRIGFAHFDATKHKSIQAVRSSMKISLAHLEARLESSPDGY